MRDRKKEQERGREKKRVRKRNRKRVRGRVFFIKLMLRYNGTDSLWHFILHRFGGPGVL